VVATTVLLKMGRLKWIWVTLVPMVWLITITMTASWQKIFSTNARIGFLSGANALAAQLAAARVPAAKIVEIQRTIFNLRLDAVVTAVLAVMILVLVFEAVVRWTAILTKRSEAVLHETPYVATQWIAGAEGD